MFNNLLKPKTDLAVLMLRVGLAAIFIVHGTMKITQITPMLDKVMSMHTQLLVGWTELAAGVLLVIGLFSRLAALAIIPIQVAAIILVTGKKALQGPTFEAAGADFTKVGPEYNMVLIFMCLAVILLGSGVVSVDHCLLCWLGRKKPEQVPHQPVGAAG